MALFRQYVAPFLVVLIFLVSLVAVSARIFLPQDMAAPAPIETVDQTAHLTIPLPPDEEVAGLPPSLEVLVKGLPIDPNLGAQL